MFLILIYPNAPGSWHVLTCFNGCTNSRMNGGMTYVNASFIWREPFG